MTMGRWSTEAYFLYVRTPLETILSVAGHLKKLLYPSFGLFCLGAVGFGHFILWGSGFSATSPFFSEQCLCLLGGPPAWGRGSWVGCLDLPAMGAVSI